MLTIDILIPTRNRPENMLRVLKSIRESATHPQSITVAFWMDPDDKSSAEAVESLKATEQTHFQELLFLVGRANPGAAMYNEMASRTNGDIIMYAADDIDFNTPGWDETIRDFFWESRDRIWLAWALDPARSEPFPDHGFISRWGRNAVKYLFPVFLPHPDIPGSVGCAYTDVWLKAMYEQIGRLKYLPEIEIAHRHWHQRPDTDQAPAALDRNYFVHSIASRWRITPEFVARNQEIPEHAKMLSAVIAYVEKDGAWLEENGLIPHATEAVNRHPDSDEGTTGEAEGSPQVDQRIL